MRRRWQESFDRTVEEGAQRLNRSFRDVLLTGLFGGFEIGVGIMAYLGVLYETGNHLLAGLAFSAGLIALLLAKSELFRKASWCPLRPSSRGRQATPRLGKLWGGTLVANLVGGWLFMALIMTAFPQWSETITKEAAYYSRRRV